MSVRSEQLKMSRLEKPSSLSRKTKKKGSKKPISKIDNWCTPDENDGNEVSGPPLDYGGMFWQQPGAIPPHMQPHNGQRLFTAMSDPSVCRYSAVPMAYTMEPVSMPPIYPLYRPVPQPNYRPYRGRGRRNIQHHQNTAMMNGYSSLQESRTSYMTPNFYQNGDYASLPPSANNEIREQIEEMSSEHRRYSDPGLGPPELDNCRSEESDSGESGSSITTVGKNNKLVLSLVEQMTHLREANTRMFKELHETKLAMETIKAELSRVKQQASLEYQPGMLSDIISEMRQANKILEETMNDRVSAIIDEKNNQRLVELEEVKERLAKMIDEKSDGDKRIAKLEEEVARLSLNANNEGREIAAFEEETLALRRELQEARSCRQLAENYATKCVNDAIMPSIMPVTFDTPCITSSTPVRAVPPISHDSISISSSQPSSLSPSNSSRNLCGIQLEVTDWKWQSSKDTIDPTADTKKNPLCLGEGNTRKESMQSLEPDEREALERLINYHLQRDQTPNSTDEIQKAYDQANHDDFHNGSTGTTSNGSNESSESDVEKSKCSRVKARRKRGISDIPDVVFVSGESLVPKDLCSTRILTSRVLTAPSRATYTTAYI